MKQVIFISIIVISAFSSCKKDKWDQPVSVSFLLDINRLPGLSDKLVFTDGKIVLENFTFDGDRVQGDDVYFTNSFLSGLHVNLNSNQISDLSFDIPQGTFTKLQVSFSTYGVNNSNHIALSNESSANETTVENSNVNHQYSKSFEFEKDFREYTEKYISGSFNYFSFLRPLSEIQIGKIFSRFTKYHLAFRSCNVGSKNDTWCGKCPKCLFAFIILSPYIERNKMIEIFGSDLLNDEDLLFYFEQLIGIEKVKPFECIGTVSEVNIAVNLIIKKIGENELPYLLKYYKSANLYEKYSNLDFKTEINNIENNHFLTDEFIKLIKDELY